MRVAATGTSMDAPPRRLRADARRNYERILNAARSEVAAYGAQASLEEIARKAGVGSATLHRHFSSRHVLLEAVFSDRVRELCELPEETTVKADPAGALVEWLRAVASFVVTTRGLAESLLGGLQTHSATTDASCYQLVSAAGAGLLERAQRSDAIRPDVTIDDLMTIVNSLSLASSDGEADRRTVDRLLRIALEGIGPVSEPQ
jgi:AcrR family transcriptional regulator